MRYLYLLAFVCSSLIVNGQILTPTPIPFDSGSLVMNPIPYIPMSNKLYMQGQMVKVPNKKFWLYEYDGSTAAHKVPQSLMGNVTALDGIYGELINGKIYFWGIINGTRYFCNFDGINPPKPIGQVSFNQPLQLNTPDSLYFIGSTPNMNYMQRTLYVFDVKNETYHQLLDTSYYIDNHVIYDRKIYFTQWNDAKAIYSYDPNNRSVTTINTGITNSTASISSITVANSKLFLHVYPNTPPNIPTIYEHSKQSSFTDISNLYSGYNNDIHYDSTLTVYNGEIYLSGKEKDGSGYHLFSLNPYNNTISNIYTFKYNKARSISRPKVTLGRIYFTAQEIGTGNQLYSYSNAEGVLQLTNYGKDSILKERFNPIEVFPWGHNLFFLSYSSQYYDFPDTSQMYQLAQFPLSTTDTKHKTITTNIYPNPTTANTTLELQLDKAKSLSVKLTDITGRTVHTIPTAEYATGKHNITLPMEQLPNGNYFYSIIDNNGMLLISGKLIKE